MITVDQQEWYRLKKSLGMDQHTGPELAIMAYSIGARRASFGPIGDLDPWVIFEFDTPEQETFARLKYL
jgi:hypothetical protein